MYVHLIFVTKYRRKVFDGDAIERLGAHFKRVANDFEAKVMECNGEDNHIHLLVEYHPKISISSLVRSMKGVSSRMIAKAGTSRHCQALLERAALESKLLCRFVLWGTAGNRQAIRGATE